ncbi:MAG TPA: hypothetical protein VGN37_15145 [Actinocatenispora sp.]
MYAVVREWPFHAGRLTEGQQRLDTYVTRVREQPGYRGEIMIDLGHGHRVTLTLWRSAAHAAAARAVLDAEIRRLLAPLLVAPSQIVAVGEVIASDVGPT